MKRLLLICLLAFALPACAGVTVSNDPSPQEAAVSLSKVTSADLAAAANIATVNGDVAGANCANALNTWLSAVEPAVEPADQPKVVGPASAFAEARVHARKAQSVVDQIKLGVPDPVHVACAPVVLDAQTLLIKLGVLLGGAATLPTLAPLAPVIGAALPVPIK